MSPKAIRTVTQLLAIEEDVDSIALILGAAIEQLSLVTNPETAADICGKAQTMLLDRGSIQ